MYEYTLHFKLQPIIRTDTSHTVLDWTVFRQTPIMDIINKCISHTPSNKWALSNNSNVQSFKRATKYSSELVLWSGPCWWLSWLNCSSFYLVDFKKNLFHWRCRSRSTRLISFWEFRKHLRWMTKWAVRVTLGYLFHAALNDSSNWAELQRSRHPVTPTASSSEP